MQFLIAALVVVALFWVVVALMYNNLVRLRQNVRESWSAIETELRRRYDLIPNLVEVVKGYASHERGTLEEVIKARNAALSIQNSPESLAQANTMLSGALRHVFALSESYPQLKANENFQELQRQLDETETRISQARRFYNANVRELNTAAESFPSVFIARAAGFNVQTYFGIDNAQAFEPPQISGLSISGNRQPDAPNQTLEIPKIQKDFES
ncbi:MAG: LemA family protein [Candidatus Melainabacteria bacterium]|nr:LemA family protein [Candidatus Melainabacteria bacterium]